MDSAEFDTLMRGRGRTIETARPGDEELGPFKWLPGTWRNVAFSGWNMIALPHPEDTRGYRLLVNEYKEALQFTVADKGAANRGVDVKNGSFIDQDQFALALDYQQVIKQVAGEDFPSTKQSANAKVAPDGAVIHHEPGLFLRMSAPLTTTIQRKPTVQHLPLEIARLGTIPHGDAVLALGAATELSEMEEIPTISGLPIGSTQDLSSNYLKPYKHFHDHPLGGLFDPTVPNALLQTANDNEKPDIVKVTRLVFDTELSTAGILNIPFVTRQANAASMRSTFWIQELREKDTTGAPKLRMQYSQVVLLDFHIVRGDGMPGRIRWPHVSINTLEKVPDEVPVQARSFAVPAL